MSALAILVRVMRTLIAPTVTVLIAVLVNKGLLEMVLSAQVCSRCIVPAWACYLQFVH